MGGMIHYRRGAPVDQSTVLRRELAIRSSNILPLARHHLVNSGWLIISLAWAQQLARRLRERGIAQFGISASSFVKILELEVLPLSRPFNSGLSRLLGIMKCNALHDLSHELVGHNLLMGPTS